MKIKFKKLEQIKDIIEYDGEILFLKHGEVYDVMGFYQENGKSFFYINVVDTYYPIDYNSNFFDIIDSRVSKHWILNINHENGDIQLMFEDWIKIPNFMNYFVEGDIDEDEKFYELREYTHYKSLLETEFS